MIAGSELGVLKWRYQSRDENLVPLSINAWPSASGKDCYVNIEYESNVDYDLQGVVIVIPLPHLGHAPTVNQVRTRHTKTPGITICRAHLSHFLQVDCNRRFDGLLSCASLFVSGQVASRIVHHKSLCVRLLL
jgi:hypothetical protein